MCNVLIAVLWNENAKTITLALLYILSKGEQQHKGQTIFHSPTNCFRHSVYKTGIKYLLLVRLYSDAWRWKIHKWTNMQYIQNDETGESVKHGTHSWGWMGAVVGAEAFE